MQAIADSIDFSMSNLNQIWLLDNSWGYVDDLVSTPRNSFRQALQDLLDARDGTRTWLVVNCSLGGKSFGRVPLGDPWLIDRIPEFTRVQRGNCWLGLGGFINDINLKWFNHTNAGGTLSSFDATAATNAIIASYQEAKTTLAGAGITQYFARTDGPFGGSDSYNAKTKAVLDAVNGRCPRARQVH